MIDSFSDKKKKRKKIQRRKKEKREAIDRVERNHPERSQPRIYRSSGTNWIVQVGR